MVIRFQTTYVSKTNNIKNVVHHLKKAKQENLKAYIKKIYINVEEDTAEDLKKNSEFNILQETKANSAPLIPTTIRENPNPFTNLSPDCSEIQAKKNTSEVPVKSTSRNPLNMLKSGRQQIDKNIKDYLEIKPIKCRESSFY